MAKEVMNDGVSAYEYAVGLTERFADWIRTNTEFRLSKDYNVWYWSYFHKSQLNKPEVRLLGLPLKNNSVSFGSMISDVDGAYPIGLDVWCYQEGKHRFFPRLDIDPDHVDFASCWSYVCKCLGISQRWVQLTLF